MIEWDHALKVRGTSLYLDSRRPRACCFVSHAHSDHLCPHAKAICSPATAYLSRHRLAATGQAHALCIELPYRQKCVPDNRSIIELFPAGHVLGSSMAYITVNDQTLLYTGDFKLRPCLTTEPADPPKADFLLMECTYGLEHFRFPPRQKIIDELLDRVALALKEGRQPIVLGYSLGKAQEITRILSDGGFPVTVHGAVANVNQAYETLGMSVGNWRRYRFDDFHGPNALDLRQRGVLVAPPQVARTQFVNAFKNPLRLVMTGWGMLKNAQYRYGVDHALPLSDHADFDELLELIERVRPKQIFTHHGYAQFAQTLRQRGFAAQLARPPAQLELFADV